MEEEQKKLEQGYRAQLDEVIMIKSDLDRHNFDLKQHIATIEINLINEALDKAHGIVAAAARILGVRRTTLIEKMKRYQIVREARG
jgi:transcriptional regulator with GAF, ATPase, and Fis domain